MGDGSKRFQGAGSELDQFLAFFGENYRQPTSLNVLLEAFRVFDPEGACVAAAGGDARRQVFFSRLVVDLLLRGLTSEARKIAGHRNRNWENVRGHTSRSTFLHGRATREKDLKTIMREARSNSKNGLFDYQVFARALTDGPKGM